MGEKNHGDTALSLLQSEFEPVSCENPVTQHFAIHSKAPEGAWALGRALQ